MSSNASLPENKTLYRTHDDHVLCLFSAKTLSGLPFWEGNRFVKEDHIESIQESLKGNILSLTKTLFRVIGIVSEDSSVQWYIFDGQHRARVLQQFFHSDSYIKTNEDGSTILCEESPDDFEILVMWKLYDFRETVKIHQDFLDCNRASPIEWTVDPNMMANAYIDALLLKFQDFPVGKGKKKKCKSFFREGKTKKPYISIDKLREDILKRYSSIGWTKSPEEFAEQAFQVNERILEGLSAKEGRTASETSMLELGFALASVENYVWM